MVGVYSRISVGRCAPTIGLRSRGGRVFVALSSNVSPAPPLMSNALPTAAPTLPTAALPVAYRATALAELPTPFAAAPPPGALRLRQAWRGETVQPGFRDGWFRVHWNETGLAVESVFSSPRPRNAARRLNEHTWELGEVAETFLQEDGATRYVEVHVTPENQRLQLRFPHGGIEELRAGRRDLASFLIEDPEWAWSQTWIVPGWWASRLVLPADCFSPGFLKAGSRFLANFSRYDCADDGDPILSATAPLAEPFYHRRQDWQTFCLVD